MGDCFATELTAEQEAELRSLINSRHVSAVVATRARTMPWHGERRARKDIGPLAGVSLPTVDRWVNRYAAHGVRRRVVLSIDEKTRVQALDRTTRSNHDRVTRH